MDILVPCQAAPVLLSENLVSLLYRGKKEGHQEEEVRVCVLGGGGGILKRPDAALNAGTAEQRRDLYFAAELLSFFPLLLQGQYHQRANGSSPMGFSERKKKKKLPPSLRSFASVEENRTVIFLSLNSPPSPECFSIRETYRTFTLKLGGEGKRLDVVQKAA